MATNTNKRRITTIVIIIVLCITCLTLGIILLRNSNHTINFYNGKTIVKIIEVKDGEKIKSNQIPSPTKTGFTLKWYSDSILTIEYNFDKPISKDKNIYAGWIPKVIGGPTNDVMLDYSGGTGIIFECELEVGTIITQSDLPDATDSGAYRLYFDFLGWSTAELPSGEGTTDNLFTEIEITDTDTIFYAVWKRIQLNLNFAYNNGSSIYETLKYGMGLETILPSNLGNMEPEHDSHILVGWNTRIDGTGSFYPCAGSLANAADVDIPYKPLIEGITLYAVWVTDYEFFNLSYIDENEEAYEITGMKILGNWPNQILAHGKISVPFLYNGKPITTLADWSFCGWGLPEDTIINIPSSITNIGYSAFSRCYGPIAFNVANNNPNYMSYENVLFNKSMTTLIAYPQSRQNKVYTVPDSVMAIAPYAFSESQFLTSVTIPDSVIIIEEWAFEDCEAMEEVIILPTSKLATIRPDAFIGCYNLERIILPDSLTNLGLEYESADGYVQAGAVFMYCINLKTIILPDHLTEFGKSLFSRCESLTEVSLPDSLNVLPAGTFSDCSNLTEINIPDSVIKIEGSAFSGAGIAEINLPKNLIELEDMVFSGCMNMTQMPDLPDKLEIIGRNMFFSSGLTSVTIPDNWTEIPYGMFDQCLSLTEIIFSDSGNLEIIQPAAFRYCTSLTEVNLPEGLKIINPHPNFYIWLYDGPGAFSNCSGLTKITLPESLEYIGPYAFSNCRYLTEININCINLKTPWLQNSSSYYSYVFSYAGINGRGITVTFGEKVEEIPEQLFKAHNTVNDSLVPKIIAFNFFNSSITKNIFDFLYYGGSIVKKVYISSNVINISADVFTYVFQSTVYEYQSFLNAIFYCEAASPESVPGFEFNWNRIGPSKNAPVTWGISYEDYLLLP